MRSTLPTRRRSRSISTLCLCTTLGALLYHPTNQARQSIGNAAMAARRPEQQQPQQPEYMRTPGTQAPSFTHHHSMSNPVGANVPQPPHSIAPHPSSGRPGLDRAHTFPTPPTSASSLTMGMGNSGSSYEYAGGQANAMQPGQPLPVESGASARTVPTTPATTPPGSGQSIQYQTTQPYDNSRQMYPTPSTFNGYSAHPPMNRYGGMTSSPGAVKHEMGPPARGGAENEHPDSKAQDGYGGHQDAEGEHEGEYTHASASYGARRASYNYTPNPASGPLSSDPSHVSPEMNHSPHQNGSSRATPRTANPYSGYNTPQRATQLPSSNLAYVMSNDTRAGATNGAEPYAAAGYQPPHYPSMNGLPPSNKRMREDDEQDPYGRPLSSGVEGLKKQRTDPGAISSRPISQPQSVKAGGMRR